MSAGIDPVTQPIPIAPAAHYHMGGVWTDTRGRTSVEGLWAIGEVASTGVHGANRLASNSLLEAVVFGARAAADIAATPLPEVDPRLASDRDEPAAHDRDFAVVEQLRDLMSANVGVIRDAAGLSGAIRAIRRLSSRTSDIEISNMLTTALMIASSAWLRRESRGAQFRSDFPHADPAFARRSRMTLAEALKLADEVSA